MKPREPSRPNKPRKPRTPRNPRNRNSYGPFKGSLKRFDTPSKVQQQATDMQQRLADAAERQARMRRIEKGRFSLKSLENMSICVSFNVSETFFFFKVTILRTITTNTESRETLIFQRFCVLFLDSAIGPRQQPGSAN